ncbi:MAG: LL-diaminopimelate aminotransferase [Gammaproteobacteria bacterium]|nr:LL-diaminopimelate aminotransferase [Gammaproteobacteria bacterium]
MTESIAERLGGKQFGKDTVVYKFEKIKRAKDEAKRLNPDIPIIDMGVGEPDSPADAGVVEVLGKEAGKPENRWYADNGIPEFQAAAANYLGEVYGVNNLDPYQDIIHGIGSKPILAMLPLCFINPGDITLATIPGYPVTSTYTKYLGGDVYNLPLTVENDFFPDLKAIPADVAKKAKLLYINYPNNPTGQVATADFFADAVEFAHRNSVVIVQDAAYAALTFDAQKPLSLLSIDGAKEVGVEVHSLSKAFNMTGWRLAFIAGNTQAVKAYGTIKDNTDSGQFRAIQKAGIYALNHREITAETCAKYSRRFDLLVNALKEVGFSAIKPKATFYCYVACPQSTATGATFSNAADFSEFLIKEAQISTVPWDDAGNYVRFSVTFSAETAKEEIAIIDEMKRRMLKLGLVF